MSTRPNPLVGASMGNHLVGNAFGRLRDQLGSDLPGLLMNWNESELNEDGDKIIGHVGRDARFSLGKEGGKIIVRKRDLMAWLDSDAPFDEKVYGTAIRQDVEWVRLINRARAACGMAFDDEAEAVTTQPGESPS
ncbi:hypothetical protein [Polaromonas sp.]|uniref:hypothetical protein n=1 Tax=Polaromonas sp. TaxID=1869339 RepID=UPI00352AA650